MPDEVLPIDETEPIATQSVRSLMLGDEELRLLAYRQPYDCRKPDQVEALRKMLKIQPRNVGVLPDDGVYYLVYLTDEHGKQNPFLLPEGEVRMAVFILAAKRGVDVARQVQYMHGMIPQ